jgi:hypothetical protein
LNFAGSAQSGSSINAATFAGFDLFGGSSASLRQTTLAAVTFDFAGQGNVSAASNAGLSGFIAFEGSGQITAPLNTTYDVINLGGRWNSADMFNAKWIGPATLKATKEDAVLIGRRKLK